LLHTITPLYLSSSLPLVSLFPSLQQVPNSCYSRFFHPLLTKRRRVSSGSIVSDYGLDDRVTGVRSQVGAKDFSSIFCVQTGSGAHPASCTMGTGAPFPGVKRGWGVTLTTHSHLVPRS
jgi:hypothetical protein